MRHRFVLTLAFALLATMPGRGAAAEPYTYVHHAVSTDRAAAQEAFDRGLTMMYGYASEEAHESFMHAAKLDPTLAMAWWGIALSLGRDINTQPEVEKTHQAAAALRHARALAKTRATAEERAYIDALSARYSDDERPDFDRLSIGYRDAMRELVTAYPADPDAAALCAEAMMDLHPWQLWASDGTPAEGTAELVRLIEEHLALTPDHIGLMHFYIHAVEASPHPERTLDAARRLGSHAMEPAAHHLIHMPAHIYLRVGDWPAAVESNRQAAHHALDYRHSGYPADEHACGHCVDFLRYAYNMGGNLAGARDAAETHEKLTQDPTALLGVLARFAQWDELLTLPMPRAEEDPKKTNPHYMRGFWHFARGLAFASTGRAQPATTELTGLEAEAKQLPPVWVVAPGTLNTEHGLDDLDRHADREGLAMAVHVLKARIAQARGEGNTAVDELRAAVAIQDQITYSEPPVWYYPVRESLGATLLRRGAAADAEAVFREDLRRNPNNPRSYFGLAAACRAQHKPADAATAEAQFHRAWNLADRKLVLADL